MVGSAWNRVRGWIDRRPSVLPLLLLGSMLIALAAGPPPPEGSWTGLPSATALRWVMGLIVGTLCLLGLTMLLLARGAAAKGESQRKPWVATLVASLFLIGLFSLIDFEGDLIEPEPVPELPEVAPGPIEPSVDPGPGFENRDITALVIILALAIVLLIWTRRSIAGPEPEFDRAEPESPLAASMSRAQELLLAGDDPRQAVLLAYRDLERTLESLGLARRDTETPTEHLDRALAELAVTDRAQAKPLRELAGLYTTARYSDHAITAAEQQQAGEALGRARQHLAGIRP